MKRKTFYQVSLSLPYIALLIAGASAYLTNAFETFDSSSTPTTLAGILVFFSFSAVIWAPLYTWMVVAMLFWGRGKSTAEIRTMYLLSPVLLACSMGFPVLLLSTFDSAVLLSWGFLHMNNLEFLVPVLFKDYQQEQALIAGMLWAFMAALSVVIGYAFVGMVLLIEKALKRHRMFTEEREA